MSEPLRIAALGLTHDHAWSNLRELTSVAGARLVAAADPNEPLLERARQEFGCATYTDYRALLAGPQNEQLNAAYIFGDNAGGVELAVAAAERKLHLLVEKPLAATLAGADRMLAAVRRGGVRMMVNWPFAWWPALQHGIALARQGAIGQLWEVKYRSAHEGPRELGCSTFFCDWLYDPRLNGAGAYMDYCCYGAALACTLLGLPSRVVGVTGRLRKEDITVDDNGMLVMSYPRAMAVAEGSWTQIGHPTAYVATFYGTAGLLLVEPGHQGRLIQATAQQPEGLPVEVPVPPEHLRTASAHFAHALATGEDFSLLCQDRIARDAQEVLAAGLLSASQGCEISLPLRGYGTDS
jgi:predicted dehydrogenase